MRRLAGAVRSFYGSDGLAEREAGVPEPELRQDGGIFVQTRWRDWLTAEVLAALGLNDRRQRAAVRVKTAGRIENGLVQSWPEIKRLAREGDPSQARQVGLFG